MRSWIGAVLVFFLFLLPLHFHPISESQQISQECSCTCGGLNQLGSAAAPVLVSNVHNVFFAHFSKTEIALDVMIESECARAPPSFL